MHELSIAQSLVESIRAEAAVHHAARVTRVGVRVGELSGVEPDALTFSFDVIVRGTELEQTTLDIERMQLRHRCERCARDFAVIDYVLVCPDCGASTRTISGDELQMTYLELE